MKNKRAILLLIIAVMTLAGCQDVSLEQEGSLDFEAQYVRTDGYSEDISYPIVSLIHSEQELDGYYNQNKAVYDLERHEKVYSDTTIGFLDAVEKYDDTYFKDNVLVLIVMEEGSGSIRHTITDVKKNEDVVEITIERIVPEMGTDDMAEWHIMVELKGEDYNNSEINVLVE